MYVCQPIDTEPVNRAVTAALECRGIADDLPAGLTLEREARAVARCSDDLWALEAAACEHLRSLARRANASAHIRAEDDRRPAGSPPIPTPQGDRMRGYFWAQVLLTVRAQLGVTEPEALAVVAKHLFQDQCERCMYLKTISSLWEPGRLMCVLSMASTCCK